LSQKFLFNPQEIEIINLLSKKNYKVSIENLDKVNPLQSEENKEMILEYLLSSESNLKKEKFLDNFLN